VSLAVSWWTYALLVMMHEAPDLDAKDPDSAYRRFDRYEELTAYLWGPRAGWWSLVSRAARWSPTGSSFGLAYSILRP
jgi:hypothetical protein